MKEIWKDIANWEGYYQVSNTGRVKSLHRKYYNGYKMIPKDERILKQSKTGSGYCKLTLSRNGKSNYRMIHRLVAQAFIKNPENKRDVNHKDGNKMNNNINNLEWMTQLENARHAYKNGLITIDHHNKPVCQINGGSVIASFKSASEASRQTGICRPCIAKCCSNKQETSGGFKWSFYQAQLESITNG